MVVSVATPAGSMIAFTLTANYTAISPIAVFPPANVVIVRVATMAWLVLKARDIH